MYVSLLSSPSSSYSPIPIKTKILNHRNAAFFFRPPSLKTQISPTKSLFISKSQDSPDIHSDEPQIQHDDFGLEVEKLGTNSRRIRSRIGIHSNLDTVWKLLTDYEKLTDFIPGLAVCQLLDKTDNYVKLFQSKSESCGGVQSGEQEFRTILSYVVDVKPKLWLPVRLVEGRLCREIKVNLLCIREEAHKAFYSKLCTS